MTTTLRCAINAVDKMSGIRAIRSPGTRAYRLPLATDRIPGVSRAIIADVVGEEGSFRDRSDRKFAQRPRPIHRERLPLRRRQSLFIEARLMYDAADTSFSRICNRVGASECFRKYFTPRRPVDVVLLDAALLRHAKLKFRRTRRYLQASVVDNDAQINRANGFPGCNRSKWRGRIASPPLSRRHINNPTTVTLDDGTFGDRRQNRRANGRVQCTCASNGWRYKSGLHFMA